MKFNDVVARALKPKVAAPENLIVTDTGIEGEVEVFIYDDIGWWGITSQDFVPEFKAIAADVIHLRIDCNGGDVFQARAMKTAIEQHPTKVIAHIDGIAASAASYLMLAADEIEIAKGAFVMIHNAWSITLGDSGEHTASAEMLEKIDQTIRADYASKSGKDADYFRPLMDAETWYEADEALEVGLVDRVFDKEGGAENRYDLSIFENPPAALLNAKGEETAAVHRAAQMRRLEYIERVAP